MKPEHEFNSLQGVAKAEVHRHSTVVMDANVQSEL